MTAFPQEILVGAGGGTVAGYATGRVTKMAVQVIKWLIGIFVGLQVALDQLGVITIHYGRAQEVMNNWMGISGLDGFMTAVTDFIFSWVPMAGGFGVGFYAGYKKIIV